MALRVYNTLTRQKEDFKPVHAGKVGMYVCGPTVYKPSHVGHMVGPVIFDTVRRYLQYLGYEVRFVVNITDVDDKLIVRARELKTTVKELAEKMTSDYLACLKMLNVEGITDLPRATEHIPEMLAIIEGLIAKGYAYPAGGDVYFDVTRDPDYGKLCHRDPEQMEAGARIEVSDRKRNPGDFALWKGAKPGEPQWDSPWGPGRPGWHIECSAMSMKYLGATLDIHGGGLDLQFPHHENELAQSESYTDQPFARYWMHNGLMKMGHTKMAGSVGNVINVVDLLKQHQPETVRFLLLGTHYRSPIEWSEERLAEVKRSLQTFYRFFERYERITKESFYAIKASKTRAERPPLGSREEVLTGDHAYYEFCACMDDDFNTGGAVGWFFGLVTDLNRFADASYDFSDRDDAHRTGSLDTFKQGASTLKELSQILGLFGTPQPRAHEIRVSDRVGVSDRVKSLITLVSELAPECSPGTDPSIERLVELLKERRNEARKVKNFGLADQIRKRLAELGVTLEDRPGGTGWRID
jgi:cysteinyl-tRNA synthetase